MHFFDVIFATRLTDSGTMYELWRQQEAGSLEYVSRAEELQQQYAERLVDEAGGDMETLFGFTITSSIGAMLPTLPKSFVSTTCEFPAVLSLLHRSGNRLAAWVCPFTRTVTPNGPIAPQMFLLVSHVDYISGRDIVSDVVDTLAGDPSLARARFTIVVDGAHGVGNHCTVRDIADVRAAFEQKLDVEDFVYVFDHNKWLHGFSGMAVTLHTGVSAPIIESIFPRRAEIGYANFDEPVSVSYNPMLPHWMANFTGPADNGFDHGSLVVSGRLTALFIASARQQPFVDVEVYESNTNMVLLTTPDPGRLFHHLEDHGYRSHLMGASRIRRNTPGGAGGIRLTFSSRSIDAAAVEGLVATLRKF
ncbi:hypothetical protein EDC02_7623 [Micromonospora sp. Llam0]|uniref:hypothetical protein n=1 Tax=Micromonospora sp. Llam0 TaxID=2485143 RepID=UPI000FAC2C73|nr:hypothetical protein [Micromonospora sp. Llam0]ROO52683.1 hypothetical protein EDC02_7623 [Micromonospora sp. Llam0]